MDITTIDRAKEVLYGYPIESFVAERDALVKAIRAGGDRELANTTKALRKPSAVAALVNNVVRQDPEGVELILQAAALLRSAQAGALEGSGVNASELQQQYRAAVGALAQSAPGRRAEVRAALEAATIDEASNHALRTGCLVVVPTPVSIFGASTLPVVEPQASPVGQADATKPVDELEERRARRKAERATKDEAEAKQAQATKEAHDRNVADKKAAEKKAAAAQAAAEKKAAAERERARKAAEKQRQKQLKALQKQHREALRAHLAALDIEAAAALAVEQGDQELAAVQHEISAAEETLVLLREQQSRAASRQSDLEQAQSEAALSAGEAQDAVEALADRVGALEEQE